MSYCITSAISPPPRKQRPARLVAAAALVAVATVLSVVSCTSSGFNSLEICHERGPFICLKLRNTTFLFVLQTDIYLYTSSQSGSCKARSTANLAPAVT